jgi:hypothetical protein
MKSRHGKIACLPASIREELNHRLANGELGTHLLVWLNQHPDVRAVLTARFCDRPINQPNLTHWRQGGFREWHARHILLEEARSTGRHTAKLAKACGPVTDHLAKLLASRYATAIAEWDGRPDSPAFQLLSALRALRHDIVALRRAEYNSSRHQLERERFDYQYAKEMHDLKVETIELRHQTARNERLLAIQAAADRAVQPPPAPPSTSSPSSPPAR